MLDSRQLAAFQAAATRTLDLTASTTRNNATAGSTDIWGTPLRTYVTQIASVACGMSELTPQQMQVYGNLIGSLRAWVVSFPISSDVRRDDRIVVSGLTLLVQVDLTPGSYPTLVQVLATEINQIID